MSAGRAKAIETMINLMRPDATEAMAIAMSLVHDVVKKTGGDLDDTLALMRIAINAVMEAEERGDLDD